MKGVVAFLWLLAVAWCAGALQPAPLPPALVEAVPRLSERLGALDPSLPEQYFLLAEEVADVAVEDSERAFARRLYLIAFDRARETNNPALAASAAIGLTDVVTLERDRRWLRAIARQLDPRHAVPAWDTVSADVDPAAAYQAATALGAVRSGDGLAARALLATTAVRQILTRFDSFLQPAGGLTRIDRDANVWPCPECRNRRTARSRAPGDSSDIICPACLGNPGPRLTNAEMVAHLRLEAMLLSGTHSSWAAQMVSDDGAPLRDPDPAAVAATLGIDTSAVLYRNGEWVRPDAPAPASAKPEEPPAEPASVAENPG